MLVRARLGEEIDPERARAAFAFFAEICDAARIAEGAESRWWTVAVDVEVGEVAGSALLSLEEAEGALEDLEAGGVLVPVERGCRIEADVLCECPALARFDLEAARGRIREHGQLVGPATALLREVVRLADADGAVRTTIPRLVDEALYGRTRITQALSILCDVGLVARTDLPNRMVRLQLRGGADARVSPAPPAVPPGKLSSARGSRMRLPTNAPLQIGGEPLEVPPGIVPELELGPDGRYYLWLGPVRIGPYDG